MLNGGLTSTMVSFVVVLKPLEEIDRGISYTLLTDLTAVQRHRNSNARSSVSHIVNVSHSSNKIRRMLEYRLSHDTI